MLTFTKSTPQSLVRQLKDLPAAPKILQKLQKLLSSENVSLTMIADLLVMEPGLSARIVQMANSTHFNRGSNKVETVLEGIHRVGVKGVKELVTYAVSSALVGRPLAAYGLQAQTLWNRAVACGLAAGYLAEHSGAVDYDDAYTSGLMHGLGLVVINSYAAKQAIPRRLPSSGYPQDFAPAERDWLGFTHATAGAALLQQWGISEPVKTAVEFQLAPEDAPEQHRRLCMTLATARWARSLFCVTDEIIPDLPSPEWLEGAGLDRSQFDPWLKRTRARYEIACTELRLGGY
ncbi:MAG: HDOD domain-containing protein [Opitutaceae bacterium]|nr:HDOD domain-containing protein [Opitutaceae bacterium]